jgi:hypothetical protein
MTSPEQIYMPVFLPTDIPTTHADDIGQFPPDQYPYLTDRRCLL